MDTVNVAAPAGPVPVARPHVPADTASGRLILRRVAMAGLVLGTVAALMAVLADVLLAKGLTAVEAVILGLVCVTLVPISLSFWAAVIGFGLRITGRHAVLRRSDPGRVSARTAIVMPVYFEDPDAVVVRLDATYRSLAATGRMSAFDIFVLSDTTDAAVGGRERAAFDAWRRTADHPHRLHYRRRPANTGRKAGNIAEFCETQGRHFDFMLVLDADSVMRGDTIVGMAGAMQADPGLGILQTTPVMTGGQTLFARILQFGGRIAGPVLSAGHNWWQQGSGNYFGHNAIIRIRPFREYCRMRAVTGLGKLNGDILSHDFVEAAYMRRAGYAVRVLPQDDGSWEELPPDLPRYAQRDRRWCNGNLQHMGVLAERGLKPLSRLHLGLGVLSYLTSAAWLALLLLGGIQLGHEVMVGWDYFQAGNTMFPVWPVSKAAAAQALFATVMLMLLAPRVLGLVLAVSDRRQRRGHGGAGRLVAGVALEALFATLLAPVMMLRQTGFITAILCGRRSGWAPQQRQGQGLTWAAAARDQALPALIGLWALLSVAWLMPSALVWLSPVLAGWLAAIPLTALSSRVDLGTAAARAGLFRIPEDGEPLLAGPATPAQVRMAA